MYLIDKEINRAVNCIATTAPRWGSEDAYPQPYQGGGLGETPFWRIRNWFLLWSPEPKIQNQPTICS
jgi:hypothetical protein